MVSLVPWDAAAQLVRLASFLRPTAQPLAQLGHQTRPVSPRRIVASSILTRRQHLDDHLSAALAGQHGSALQHTIKTGVCHRQSPSCAVCCSSDSSHLCIVPQASRRPSSPARWFRRSCAQGCAIAAWPGMGRQLIDVMRAIPSLTEQPLSLAPRAVGSETMCRLSFSLCRISSPRAQA